MIITPVDTPIKLPEIVFFSQITTKNGKRNVYINKTTGKIYYMPIAKDIYV